VGNEVREVEAGKLMIFDDSMEHEAWNDGPSVRVILLFEIWRPELDDAEIAALTAMYQAIGNYPAG
jgi:aspartyl/asparaginyl beta-hydroxylase (cupin superfamily)